MQILSYEEQKIVKNKLFCVTLLYRIGKILYYINAKNYKGNFTFGE